MKWDWPYSSFFLVDTVVAPQMRWKLKWLPPMVFVGTASCLCKTITAEDQHSNASSKHRICVKSILHTVCVCGVNVKYKPGGKGNWSNWMSFFIIYIWQLDLLFKLGFVKWHTFSKNPHKCIRAHTCITDLWNTRTGGPLKVKHTLNRLKQENRTVFKWLQMLQSKNGGVWKEKAACGCLYIHCHVPVICECLMHSRVSNVGWWTVKRKEKRQSFQRCIL